MPDRSDTTVLLPVRDAGTSIDEALRSVLAQSLSPLEVLVVDDGADEQARTLLAEHRAADARVRVVPCEGCGLVDALNTGLAHARGTFALRMDADDVAHPERLALQRAFFATRGDIAVVSCLVESFPRTHVREGYLIYERWLNALTEPAQIAREIFVESPLPHPSVLFPLALVRDAGGYRDDGGPEDYDLWLRLHRLGHRFAKVPEVLHYWRDHPDRLTRRDGRYALERFLETKARHLVPVIGERTTFVWGAGMIDRRIGRRLLGHGVSIEAFVDIDPKKIGRTRHGRPVVAPSDLPDPTPERVVLAAVGSRHARGLIRARLLAAGWVEGTSFLAVA